MQAEPSIPFERAGGHNAREFVRPCHTRGDSHVEVGAFETFCRMYIVGNRVLNVLYFTEQEGISLQLS